MKIISVKTINIKNDSLKYPSGICYDRAKNAFYIADMYNHRVCLVDRDSGNIKILTGQTSNHKPFERPLAVSMSGSLGCIVADAGNNDIYYYQESNRRWSSVMDTYIMNYSGNKENMQSLNLPAGVTTDSEGNIYTNDFLNNRISVIDSDFNISVIVGGNGSGFLDGPCNAAKINKPYGVFCYGRRLYFADEGNNAVRFVDLNLMEVFTAMSDSSSGISIMHPIALTLDDEGNIFICEKRRLLCIGAKTGRLELMLDSNLWSELQKDFELSDRICHIGAVVAPEKESIYWLDTIAGLLYEVKFSF